MIRGQSKKQNDKNNNQRFQDNQIIDNNQVKWILWSNLKNEIRESYHYIQICPVCQKYCPRNNENPVLIPPDYFPKVLSGFHKDCAGKIHPSYILQGYFDTRDLHKFIPYQGTLDAINFGTYSLRVYLNLEFLHPVTQVCMFKIITGRTMFFNEATRNWEFKVDFNQEREAIYDVGKKFLACDFYNVKMELDIPYYRTMYFRRYFLCLEENRNIGSCFYQEIEPGKLVLLILNFKRTLLNRKDPIDQKMLKKLEVQKGLDLQGWLLDQAVVRIPGHIFNAQSINYPQNQQNRYRFLEEAATASPDSGPEHYEGAEPHNQQNDQNQVETFNPRVAYEDEQPRNEQRYPPQAGPKFSLKRTLTEEEVQTIIRKKEQLLEACLYKKPSMSIQKYLKDNRGKKEKIWEFILSIESDIQELMCDNYGNFVYQALVPSCDSQQIEFLINIIDEPLIKISSLRKGTFSVQSLIENIKGNNYLEAKFLGLMKGRIISMLQGASSSFVVKKSCEIFSPSICREIAREIMQDELSLFGLIKEKQVVPILKKLMSKFNMPGFEEDLAKIIGPVCKFYDDYCTNAFYHFLLQHTIEIYSESELEMEEVFRVISKLIVDKRAILSNNASCNTIAKIHLLEKKDKKKTDDIIATLVSRENIASLISPQKRFINFFMRMKRELRTEFRDILEESFEFLMGRISDKDKREILDLLKGAN